MTLKEWRRERRRRIFYAVIAWTALITSALVTVALLYGALAFWLVMAR